MQSHGWKTRLSFANGVQSQRVLIVTESFLPSINGVTNSVVQVVKSLRERSADVLIVAPTGPAENPNSFLGFPVIRSYFLPFAEFPVAIPGFFLRGVIEDFGPDVIHVASPFMLGFQALTLANQMGIPTVSIYQTDLAGYAQRYGLKLLKNLGDNLISRIHSLATVNLAPTPLAAKYLTDLGAKNVHLWGRGVELDRFHPNNRFSATRDLLRSEFAGDEDVVIGFVGRLNPEKQVERIAELFNLSPKIKFLVVGDGPEREKLQARFAKYPVTFTGKLTGGALDDAYAAIDIFVHFGIEETFGQTIQEAMASGVPVVAPDAGGPKFLIDSGYNGYLVDPEEPGGYRAAVATLLSDDNQRKRMGEAARRSVLAKSWHSINQHLFEHYESAIEQVSRGKAIELA